VLKLVPRHDDVLGIGGIAPNILNLGIRWRWEVSFTPRPLYSEGKIPQYPLDRRLGEPQSKSRRVDKGKIYITAPAGNWTPVVQRVAYSMYWLD
jgi:hypothetical protein